MALADHGGGHAVDDAVRNAEGPESGAGVGEARRSLEADDAKRDAAADVNLQDWGRGRGDGNRVAKRTRNHDVGWAKRLRSGERQGACLLEIIAQSPLAIDPDAVSVGEPGDG